MFTRCSLDAHCSRSSNGRRWFYILYNNLERLPKYVNQQFVTHTGNRFRSGLGSDGFGSNFRWPQIGSDGQEVESKGKQRSTAGLGSHALRESGEWERTGPRLKLAGSLQIGNGASSLIFGTWNCRFRALDKPVSSRDSLLETLY